MGAPPDTDYKPFPTTGTYSLVPIVNRHLTQAASLIVRKKWTVRPTPTSVGSEREIEGPGSGS